MDSIQLDPENKNAKMVLDELTGTENNDEQQ